MNRKQGWLVCWILTALFLIACSDDPKPSEPDEDSPHLYVNSWIYNNMRDYYYWTSQMITNPNYFLEPRPFFGTLRVAQDRFSWIEEDFPALLASLQGVNQEAGYEFNLYLESAGSSNVEAQVVYVKRNSPAETAGVRRGDRITHINGSRITTANYSSLLQETSLNHSVTLIPINESYNGFGTPKTVNLSVVELAENPNYLAEIYNINNVRVGYYVYNLFSTGPTQGNTQYNAEMDAIFAEFKNEGIDELVIDLRYNSGGAESATVNLASLIAPNVSNANIFAKRRYNQAVTQALRNQYGDEIFNVRYTSKAANIGNQLRNNRVYILTTRRTASASELLINGLRPYMDVILIGEKTNGKRYGSITLYEENDPQNRYGMQPIVMQSFNSRDESDYDEGFIPNIEAAANILQVYPLGDPRELFLNTALAHIDGSLSMGRLRTITSDRVEVGSTLEFRRKHINITIDDAPTKKLFE